MKKIIIIFLSLLLLVSSSACSKKQADSEMDSSELTAWANNSTETSKQVIENIDSNSKQLKISMAKGEKEGTQLMLTAKQDFKIKSVEVERFENGMSYIPTENVSIYFEYYTEITHKDNSNPEFQNGDKVSDALLPMETALEYGMTFVNEGNTQALYIEVTSPSNVVAGTYSSSVIVKTNNGRYTIPIILKIWDFDISSDPVCRNYFITNARWEQFGSAELDSTEEMATIYFEKALEYKMNGDIPYDGTGGVDRYVELVRKYYNWQNFTTYRLYYKTAIGGMDVALFREYLCKLVEASVNDKIDYLSKAIIYFSNLVDEPKRNEQFVLLSTISNQFEDSLKYVNQIYQNNYSGTSDYTYFSEVVSKSLLTIPNIMPYAVYSSIGTSKDKGIEVTTCALINFFDSESFRASLFDMAESNETQNELWFYTANIPKYPYPTTHLDDYNLPLRIISWMQAKYNISGYLNWATAIHYVKTGESPYENDAVRADAACFGGYGNTPGDGFFFYPGVAYGISGPVGSLRAVSYRDGAEDYEIINKLQDIYEEKNLDYTNILNSLYSQLFSDVISFADTETFNEVKESLCEMIETASGDCGIIYKSIDYSLNVATVEICTVDSNAKIYCDDSLLQSQSGVYTINIDLRQKNTIEFKVVNGDSEKKYTKTILGKYNLINSLTGSSALSLFNVNADSDGASVNTDSRYIYDGCSSSIKIGLTGKQSASTAFKPFITMDLSSIDYTKMTSLSFMVYCNDHDGIDFEVSSFTGVAYSPICTIHMNYGWNEIKIDMNKANLKYDNKLYFRTDNILDSSNNKRTIDLYFNLLSYLAKED